MTDEQLRVIGADFNLSIITDELIAARARIAELEGKLASKEADASRYFRVASRLIDEKEQLLAEVVRWRRGAAQYAREADAAEKALDAYRDAVRVDAQMDGPKFGGCNASQLKRAWEADRARSAIPDAKEPSHD